MIALILAVLALFVVQTFVPSVIRQRLATGIRAHVAIAIGPRDDPPPISQALGRAQRALANMQEALPVFLTLALLHIIRQ
ncbi:MAG: MAPEG family protein, partial [Myxococcota bacterium]|nr:MAPEG family protein [Myxococcota bacterium]